MEKTYTEDELKWLIEKYGSATDRYIEAEQFIVELLKMPWYRRAFCFSKIMDFIHTRKKYGF